MSHSERKIGTRVFTIEVHLDVIEEVFDEGAEDEERVTFLDRERIVVSGGDLTASELNGLTEVWGQSDWFYGEFNENVIAGMTAAAAKINAPEE